MTNTRKEIIPIPWPMPIWMAKIVVRFLSPYLPEVSISVHPYGYLIMEKLP